MITLRVLRRLFLIVLLLFHFSVLNAQFGVFGRSIGQGVIYQGPCDVASGCVAAHSVTRRLLASYGGNLFQLSRTGGGGGTLNIGQSGNAVDIGALSAFCGGVPTNSNGCAYHQVYDHEGNGHTLIAVHCDVPLTFDSSNLPTITTGAAINSGGLPCFLNDSTGSTPSGGVDASVYSVALDTNAVNNASCGWYGLYHPTAAMDTPGTDLGLIWREDVAGHRGGGFDLEEEVIEVWAGTYSKDASVGFSTLANPTEERVGRFVLMGSYKSSTQTLHVNFNDETSYNWVGTWTSTSGPTSSNTGPEIRWGAGGDGCATESTAQEGAVFNRTLSAADETAIRVNTASYYGISTLPSCGNTVVGVLGKANVTAAGGLARINQNWRGALAVVHDGAHSTVNAVMANGCDIDLAKLAALCTGSCEVQRGVNQVQTGHLEDYRTGSADPWNQDQASASLAPVITASCLGSLPCMTVASASSQQLSGGAAGLTLTRPYSISVVGLRTSGTLGGMVVFSGSQPFLGGGAAGNQALFQSSSGGGSTITAADGTWFARMGTATSAGSNNLTIALNGARTTSTQTTTNISGSTMFIGNNLTGKIAEWAIIPSAVSAGNEGTIATKQCTYWGFTSC